MQFITWKNGWKTYVTVVLGVALGVADAFNYTIPHLQTIEIVLGFLGIGFGRMAITNHSKQTAQSLAILLQDVLQQVAEPTTVTTVTTTTPPKSVVMASDDTVTTTAILTGPVTITPLPDIDLEHPNVPLNKGGQQKR